MQQRHPVPEIGGEPRHHLGRQGDLRHKDHHGSSLCQQFLRQPDIHQRFAAAGDALQQRYAALSGQRPLQDILIRLLLLVVQCNVFRLYGICFFSDPVGLLRPQGDHAALFQRRDRLPGDSGEIAQFMDGGLPLLKQELHRVIHAPRAFLPGLRPCGGLVLRQYQTGQLHRLVLHGAAAQRLPGDDAPLFQTAQ